MIGNEAARALLAAARRRRARVLLVGDRDQLPAIEAGHAFGLLLDHGLEVATIDTIVRQKDPDLRRSPLATSGSARLRTRTPSSRRKCAVARSWSPRRTAIGAS